MIPSHAPPGTGHWLRALCLACAALAAAGAPAAQPVSQPAAEPAAAAPEPAEPAPEEVVYAAPTTLDRIGRIMAPVMINGRGPFSFIVDSGASRSTLAPRLVRRLGLAPDESARLALRGVTGSESVPSILVDSLTAGDIRLVGQRLPVLPRDIFAGADGILGVEGLAGMCLRASFTQNRMSIARNGCPPVARDWLRIKGRLRHDRLLVVPARIGRSKVLAIIDTGAERSLGNAALLRVLELERQAEDPEAALEVHGATSQVAIGSQVPAPAVYLGDAAVGRLWVTFGDFEVFRLWQLESQPTLVLGMDVLGTVDSLMIDYRRGELRVLPRADALAEIRLRHAPSSGRMPRR